MDRSVTQKGFTIVELLIVIVVIGILAAITIVSFNGVQGKSHDAAVRNDIEAYGKKILLYYVDNGDYPRTVTQLNSIDIKLSVGSYANHTNAIFYCINGSNFAIGGASWNFANLAWDPAKTYLQP